MFRLMSQIATMPRQRGFTLLEVLIAVIVLSLGLLGLAKLQTVGLTANNIAYQRSQAAILAYEGVDMVYADRENAWTRKGCYNVDFGVEAPKDCRDSPNHEVVPDWVQRIENTLPNGEGKIRVVDGKGFNQLVEVIVRWRRWNEEDGWDTSKAGSDEEKWFQYQVASGI